VSFSVLNIPIQLLRWLQIALASYRLKKLPATEREQAHQALAALLATTRGMTMKIGQFMASGTVQDPYQSLVTSITPLPLAKVLPTLQQQLPQPLQLVFSEIRESTAAASLGQVHYAVLADGSAVAIKIRYPGIVETIHAELQLTDWLPSAGPFKRWQFNSEDYKQTLRRQLLRETDYRIEAQTQQRFKENLAVKGLWIPKIYTELSTSSVLVQSWETGCRIHEVALWSKKHRLEIARTLLVTLFQSLFVHGEIHADPHSGNYLFRLDTHDNPVVVLLDYGCTVFVTKTRRLALLKLIDAYANDMPINALQCFVAMGFHAEKLAHIADTFPALCAALFLPFTQARAFELEQWQLATTLQQLLSEQRWWFRAAGPADLLLLLRAFYGLVQQLTILQVALPWAALLRYSVGESVLEQARQLILPELSEITQPHPPLLIKARKLCVQVYEHNQLTISLDLPAEAALELESLIPAAVLAQIHTSTEVDLLKLTAKLQQQGIVPQVLFETQNDNKRCRVWLE
jgi:predicted unusual protein kinase regulating ubiquinone biosynthesis (AarF/ABC1/UbiB family)